MSEQPATMRAAVFERYGPPEVVELRDVRLPEVSAGDVLIKVVATTVSSGDWRLRSMDVPFGFGFLSRLMFGISKPKQPILGTEAAGVIEAVGESVTAWKPGDEVFISRGDKMGCHAEYVGVPESSSICRKPSNLSTEEAAALSFGGVTALHFLRQAKLLKGEALLINGASGAVGSAAVQIAKHLGAEVTGVCSSANADMVGDLGADHVIDYAKEDFAEPGERYDIIMDCVGTAQWPRSKPALKPGGRLIQVSGTLVDMLRPMWVNFGSRKLISGVSKETPEILRDLADMAEAGAYKPVIDSGYSLDQIVEAHRRVDSGHKRGCVVVTL